MRNSKNHTDFKREFGIFKLFSALFCEGPRRESSTEKMVQLASKL